MRPEGPKIEVEGRERGWSYWGGCSKSPAARGLGSAVSSPSEVWGGAPTPQRVSTISELRMASPDTIIFVDHKKA